jgi:hypothetical protein
MSSGRSSSKPLNKSAARLRAEPQLQILEGTFCDDALRNFVSDCIVPALVDSFLRSRLSLQDSIGHAHNVDQL